MNSFACPRGSDAAPPPAYQTDVDALAKARALWGDAGFADTLTCRLGVRCRVGIMVGTTQVVFANAGTWGEAFRMASAGEESYRRV